MPSAIRFPSILRRSRYAALCGAVEAALAAVDPERCVESVLAVERDALRIGERALPLSSFGRIRVVGAGKAAARMARAVYRILGDRIDGGCVAVHALEDPPPKTGPIAVVKSAHPVPDAASVVAGRRISNAVSGLGRDDLVLVLISGGASALLTVPAEGLSLCDLQQTNELLLRSGADIASVNTVRKHLSAVKGGRLAERAAPARVVGLILSDVVGDPPHAVGSGPVAPDPSTFRDALSVCESFGVLSALPRSVQARLSLGAAGGIPDTPGEENPVFERVENRIVGGNGQAVEAAVRYLNEAGVPAIRIPEPLIGEARDAGPYIVERARAIRRAASGDRPFCAVFGGETTVRVVGDGRGGRNQEVALAAACALEGMPETTVLTLATDGRDGPTDAAGAAADGSTLFRAKGLGLHAERCLEYNNSYQFFARLGDLLMTGPTHTNAADVTFVVCGIGG